MNGRAGLGRVQEQLVTCNAASLQLHRVPDPQATVTEKEHKRPDAADILRGTVFPASAFPSLRLATCQNLAHLLRRERHCWALRDSRAFQFAGVVLIKPLRIVSEAAECPETLKFLERA
jgi:hypothetical protein